MRTLKLSATLMLLGTLTLGVATETNNDTTTQTQEQEQTQTQEQKQTNSQSHAGVSSSVDAQIVAIENAKTQEQRVALVNEFKTTISTLSSQERATAISQYRSSMQATNEQTQNRQRSNEGQMRQTRDTQEAQMMNQYQTANQAMHSGVISGNINSVSSIIQSAGNINNVTPNASSTNSGSTQTNFMTR